MDKDLIPSECTIKQIKDALRWANKGGRFDHIREDVPKAAQPWVKARLAQVEKRFLAWATVVKMWSRQDGELPLSVLEPALREWVQERVMPTLAGLKSFYEEAKETGWKDRLWQSMEFSKDECQEAYDFIVSGQMPDRINELSNPLQWNLGNSLEVPVRHLEKEADAARGIASGIWPMSRTAKDVDAPCKQAVESGLPDLIAALKIRLRELRREKKREAAMVVVGMGGG